MLKGERVLLRAMRREDMLVQFNAENDAEMYFWDGDTPKPKTLEALYAIYDDEISKPQPHNVSFAIEVDGHYIGHCGIHGIDGTNRAGELGIEISNRDYWGKGYGREVIRLLLRYGFEHLNLNRVHLHTHSENDRAIRCYLACGFKEEGRFRQEMWLKGHYVDGIAMAILREEYYS